MNPGDISVFVNSVGEKHVGVVCAVNPDATVDICVLKPTHRAVKLTATGEPGTFFDPTMPVDEPVTAQDTTTAPVLASVPPDLTGDVTVNDDGSAIDPKVG